LKKSLTTALVLTVIMAFMELTGLPAALLPDINIADINPIYFTLMTNFLFAFFLCWLWRNFVNSSWHFGLELNGICGGLKKYGLPAAAATAAVTVTLITELWPLNNTPSALRVIIEGIVYYIGVGIIEELYLRGLLQNIIEKLLKSNRNAALYAVLCTSVLFGAGHAFGAMHLPVRIIMCKILWAAALGVYFGAVYCKTRNLWVPIILHTFIDFCGIPFCFTLESEYPPLAFIASLIVYLMLGIYGIVILKKNREIK